MSWGPTEVPEPFRYSRAHSYPPPPHYGGGSSNPGPEGRGRLLIAALVGFAVVGLLGFAVFKFLLASEPPPVAQPDPCAPTASATPSPEVPDVVPPPPAPAVGPSPATQQTAVPAEQSAPRSSSQKEPLTRGAASDLAADAVLERRSAG